MRGQVGRARHQPRRHPPQQLRAERRVAEPPHADRQIVAALDQGDVAIGQVELEPQRRAPPPQLRQRGPEQALADGDRHAHAQGAARRTARELGDGVAPGPAHVEQVGGVAGVELPSIGEVEAPGGPREQRRAELALELGHRARHRGGALAQRLGGRGEAAGADHLQERLGGGELVEASPAEGAGGPTTIAHYATLACMKPALSRAAKQST
ncbi:MAG: hypothetical protein R2939_12560 [Kofleriaceae bacterium]